jgi:hypothetical protein
MTRFSGFYKALVVAALASAQIANAAAHRAKSTSTIAPTSTKDAITSGADKNNILTIYADEVALGNNHEYMAVLDKIDKDGEEQRWSKEKIEGLKHEASENWDMQARKKLRDQITKSATNLGWKPERIDGFLTALASQTESSYTKMSMLSDLASEELDKTEYANANPIAWNLPGSSQIQESCVVVIPHRIQPADEKNGPSMFEEASPYPATEVHVVDDVAEADKKLVEDHEKGHCVDKRLYEEQVLHIDPSLSDDIRAESFADVAAVRTHRNSLEYYQQLSHLRAVNAIGYDTKHFTSFAIDKALYKYQQDLSAVNRNGHSIISPQKTTDQAPPFLSPKEAASGLEELRSYLGADNYPTKTQAAIDLGEAYIKTKEGLANGDISTPEAKIVAQRFLEAVKYLYPTSTKELDEKVALDRDTSHDNAEQNTEAKRPTVQIVGTSLTP